MKMKKQKKFVSLSTRIIVGLTGVMLLVISGSGYLIYREAHRLLSEDAFVSMKEALRHSQKMFRREINIFKKDVALLAGSPPIEGIMRSRKSGHDSKENTAEVLWKSRLETIFTTVLNARPEYLQIRFIGASQKGKEIVRVDRMKNRIETVTSDHLQEKGSRSYFLQTQRLGKNQVYVSRIGLNRENGKIDVPYQPVLRVSTPVYDKDTNEFFGILIINVDIDSIFQRVFKGSKFYSYEVANDQGFYLFHIDPKRTYGFEFDQGNQLQNDYPQMRDFLLSSDSGEDAGVQQFSLREKKKILISSKYYFYDQDKSRFLIINLLGEENLILAQSRKLDDVIILIESIAMLFLLVFVLVSVREGLKPLVALSNSAKKIAKGSFPEDLLKVRRNDEIGEVTASFNDMVENLKTSTISIEVLHREIEERKKAEKVAEEVACVSRESPAPILRVSKEGVLMFANEASQIILQKWGREVGDDVPQEYKSLFNAALEAGEIRDVELNIADKNYAVTLAPQKEYGYVNFYADDISSRLIAEKNLRKSLKELGDFKVAIDEHAIVAITDIEGKITYVNDKFSEISQYSRDELIGQDHRIINSGYHPTEFISELWMTISLGKVWHGEVRNKAKDGSFYWVDTTIVPFRDVSGKIYQYLVIRTLISRIKEAEEKARVAAKAKSDFLANMSHEIRTPMNSILGFSDLLRKTPLNEKQKNYLDTVRSSGSLLLGVIDDILDILKIESGKITLESKDCNLENLIMDVFKMIVARMKDRPFDTYIDIADNVPKVIKSDPIRLKQVLVNLLGNAVKFTSEGSIGVLVELEEGTQNLRFSVKDTGIGIPQEKLLSIFESFTQADETTTRRFGGTGLGLAISKAIVETMGGKILIESEEGKGSEFIFSIPFKEGVQEEQEIEKQLSKNILKDKKVFIVDDNQIARRIIEKCCGAIGLEVIGIADSARSALHKLDKSVKIKGLIPDLILCDIMMEGMDGYELVRKIKGNKDFKKTKYLAVTADFKAEISVESQEGIFDGYVTKPVNGKELLMAITELLNIKTKEEEEKKEEESCSGIKVLVVEDVEANRMLMGVYCDQLGCKADYSFNGKEAVEKMKENKYDVVLMDLQMPVMGGIEATEIIRTDISKDVPIIALTAAVLKEDREKARKAGMTDFLMKPIDIAYLKEKLLQYGRT